jgi:hypothetical protein
MKKLLFILLASILLTSCGTYLSVEKRHYMPGYHIETAHKPKNDKELNFKEDSVYSISQPVEFASTSNELLITKPISENVFASKKIYKSLSVGHDKVKAKPIEKVSYKKSIPFKKKGKSNGGLMVVGWIFIMIGVVVLLLVSILGGALIAALGLVFVIASISGKNNSEPEKKKESELQDVIYLKNGSIVRGVIIEQIPNESLKIQTKDGNVFVYKIDEVMKMTKEQSK